MKCILTLFIILLVFKSEAQKYPTNKKYPSYKILNWKITDYENYVSEAKGIVVVNFWATFCKPCIGEIPGMIRICKDKNIPLVLVSVDARTVFPRKLNLFVDQRKWDTKIAWLNETNADYFCPRVDEKWSGSIPATVIINKDNGKRYFVEGDMNEREFSKAIEEVK